MTNELHNRLKGRIPLEVNNQKLLHGEKGTYRITEVLNCGGNYIIYRAETEDGKPEFVIKETYPLDIPGLTRTRNGCIESAVSKKKEALLERVDRAKREIGIMQTLVGREGGYNNYVDFTIDAFEANNTFYYVGPYLDYKPLPTRAGLLDALYHVKRILEALAPLHESDLLHLDISPGNILQTNMKPDEIPIHKIIDFGSAYWLSEVYESEKLPEFTKSGEFTAPELRVKRLDNPKQIRFAADLYSVGKVFCHLLGIEHEPINKKIIELNDDCCKGMGRDAIELSNEIIIKALESNPCERFQTVAEMMEAVKNAIGQADVRQLILYNAYDDAVRFYHSWRNDQSSLYDLTYDKDQYISMTVVDENDEKKEYNAESFLSELRDEETKHAVLFGDGGMGKTTTCMRLMEDFIAKGDSILNTLTIYISLRDYNPESPDPLNVVTLKSRIYKICGVAKIHDDKLRTLIYDTDWLFDNVRMTILLDGFNEMDANHSEFTRELNELAAAKNIQILITSRADVNKGVARGFRKLKLKPIGEGDIDTHLKDKDIEMSNELYQILGNPMMLKLYNYDCERNENAVPVDYYYNPITVGEILWNYIGHQILNSRKLLELNKKWSEFDKLGKMLFRHVLPFVAYHIEKRDKLIDTDMSSIFVFTVKELESVLTLFEKYIETVEDFGFPTHKDDIKEMIEPRAFMKLCASVFRFIREIYEGGDVLEFTHQHFRDLFAATHIMNQMHLKDKSVFTERVLPTHILWMLSDILQEHKYDKELKQIVRNAE